MLLYFVIEGAVRIFVTVPCDVVLPTLPLRVVAWGHGYAIMETKMGPRIADRLEPTVAGKYDRIASCRPKDWNRLVTVRYNDQMYELQSGETGQAPRPFVYVLRLKPEYKMVRGVRDYDSDEPARKPGWADMPENQHS